MGLSTFHSVAPSPIHPRVNMESRAMHFVIDRISRHCMTSQDTIRTMVRAHPLVPPFFPRDGGFCAVDIQSLSLVVSRLLLARCRHVECR